MVADADDRRGVQAYAVVSGQSYVGEVITQQTPCAVWDYGDVGIMLRRLTPGVVVTLRASAAGYLTVKEPS